MSGSATLTTVMSSSSMKIATETAISVHHLRSTPPSFPRVRPPGPDLPPHYMNAPAPARRARGGALWGLRGRPDALQGALEERHELAPQLRRGLGPVGRAVVGEERVAGAVVDVDFDLLAGPGGGRAQRALAQLVAELGRGVVILGADGREQRALQVLLDHLERRRRALLGRALVERRAVDEASPAVDRGGQLFRGAREQQR